MIINNTSFTEHYSLAHINLVGQITEHFQYNIKPFLSTLLALMLILLQLKLSPFF